MRSCPVLLLLVLSGPLAIAGSPGLAITFESREAPATRDARIARLAALHVPVGARPTPFLPAGPFRATWRGSLAIEFFDDFTFAVRGHGRVEVRIDGSTILATDVPGDLTAVPPVTVELDAGPRALEVVYDSPAEGDAWFALDWESFDFPREPVPPTALLHDPDDPALQGALQVRRGRELVTTLGCVRCHSVPDPAEGPPELEERAPDLRGIGSRLLRSWMEGWIDDPAAHRASPRMPRALANLGPAESRAAAEAIAAWLTTCREDRPARPSGDPAVGESLFAERGCTGCHHVDLTDDRFGGTRDERIALRDLGTKWRVDALTDFLLDPHRSRPSSRMPDFFLEDYEASALAAWLLGPPASTSGDEIADEPPGELVARGRELFGSSGCRACHASELGAAAPGAAAPLADLATSRAAGCLADGGTGGRGPSYALDSSDREAIRSFLAHGTDSLRASDPVEVAERTIDRLRCRACHARDAALDLWSRNGDTASPDQLTPPAGEGELRVLQDRPPLTWTGEKLRTAWLAAYLAAGRRESDRRPRPWLAARMPRFALDARTVAVGLARSHGLAASDVPAPADPGGEGIARLLGPDGGFNCVSCHDVAGRSATSVFDARGPDLALSAARLRYDHYRRWMRDPTRLLPATRMPKFTSDGRSPYGDILGGDAEAQFLAIWHHLRRLMPGGERGDE